VNAIAPMLEHVPCPLCGGKDHKLRFTRRDHTHAVTQEQFRVVSCRTCGFVFVNPRPTIQSIGVYYPQEFYQVDYTPEQLLRDKQSTLDARLAMLQHLAPGRLLDVGCQKGEFLYVMKQRGWDVVGVEFSPTPPNVFGLPIHYTQLKDAPLDQDSFDLITLWAVLEHAHDPVDLLKGVARLLKRTGRLYVLVPNFNSIAGRFLRHDDIPRHLVMFTPSTLRRAAASAGLTVRSIKCSDDIFSGSSRGLLNYLWKLVRGEAMQDIVAQTREPGRWYEFAMQVHGRSSRFMLYVDRLDIWMTPYRDRILNALGFGFITTAELVRTGVRSDA
jgi:SAM-dependent methyltransferase